MSERSEITRELVAAGATQGAVSMWWGSPHPELNYFSPRTALDLFPAAPGVRALVMRVARGDARDLERMTAEPRGRASAVEHIEPGRGRAIERCRGTV